MDALSDWRASVRAANRSLVVTNGCFDILHAGHVHYLEEARRQGDLLLVGVNSDLSVRQLKGPSRPVNPEEDRAIVLAALQCVDAVCIFSEVRATRFLRMAQPDVYVKGGDLTLNQLPDEERRAVEDLGGRIHLMKLLPGRSTSAVLDRVRQLSAH